MTKIQNLKCEYDLKKERFTYNLSKVSGVSPVAGQKNGRSNRKRNSEKANVE